jgi:hypothetical protein
MDIREVFSQAGPSAKERADRQFAQTYSHDKDLIDLRDPSDRELVKSINPKVMEVVEAYESMPQKYIPTKPFVVRFGNKTVIIPPVKGLKEKFEKELAPLCFMSEEVAERNIGTARNFIQNVGLLHTERPKSATLHIRYSTGTDSGIGSDAEREIALVPRLDRLVQSLPPDYTRSLGLVEKGSHKLMWQTSLMRAMFDDAYRNEIIDTLTPFEKNVLRSKVSTLYALKNKYENDPEAFMAEISWDQLTAQLLKDLDRKFEYTKIHSARLKTGKNWYPVDFPGMIKEFITGTKHPEALHSEEEYE